MEAGKIYAHGVVEAAINARAPAGHPAGDALRASIRGLRAVQVSDAMIRAIEAIQPGPAETSPAVQPADRTPARLGALGGRPLVPIAEFEAMVRARPHGRSAMATALLNRMAGLQAVLLNAQTRADLAQLGEPPQEAQEEPVAVAPSQDAPPATPATETSAPAVPATVQTPTAEPDDTSRFEALAMRLTDRVLALTWDRLAALGMAPGKSGQQGEGHALIEELLTRPDAGEILTLLRALRDHPPQEAP